MQPRPPITPSNPAFLLQPDPHSVTETLSSAAAKLSECDLTIVKSEDFDSSEVVTTGTVQGQGKGEANCQEAIMPDPVNYDKADGEDDANAMSSAINALKGKEFEENDLKFYFKQVEIKMKGAGVKKNFTKLEVLSSILPTRVIN